MPKLGFNSNIIVDLCRKELTQVSSCRYQNVRQMTSLKQTRSKSEISLILASKQEMRHRNRNSIMRSRKRYYMDLMQSSTISAYKKKGILISKSLETLQMPRNMSKKRYKTLGNSMRMPLIRLQRIN